jgi:hypothetical protein
MKAWESLTLNAVTGNDQTGKKWQRIKDKFHLFMPAPSSGSLRSLQHRYDVIKQCCSHWGDFL